MGFSKIAVWTMALVVAFGGAGCASDGASSKGATITLGAQPTKGAEGEHAKLLEAASAAYQKRGFAGLAPHLGALREALDKAPAAYPAIEQQPDGRIFVRANDMEDGIILSVAAAGMGDKTDKKQDVVQVANVYPAIALMLGSEAVERRAYGEAITYLDHGIALQPAYWAIINEKAAALVGMGRLKDALALADGALASDDLLLSMHQAPFHRRRGYVLVEQGRLDEARAAYEASLKDEPDSQIAKSELEYIKNLQSGKPKTPGVQVAPGAKGQGNQQ